MPFVQMFIISARKGYLTKGLIPVSEIKIGIQLYTLRDYIKNYEDTDKTFAYLKKELGVDVVQISAIGDFEAEKQAELV